MYEFRSHLEVPVMVEVGAAFDFLAGTARQAPAWMRDGGLEWLFRLTHEPGRLRRRYLVLGPQFAWKAGWEIIGNREQSRRG